MLHFSSKTTTYMNTCICFLLYLILFKHQTLKKCFFEYIFCFWYTEKFGVFVLNFTECKVKPFLHNYQTIKLVLDFLHSNAYVLLVYQNNIFIKLDVVFRTLFFEKSLKCYCLLTLIPDNVGL